jgi:hypothetical protein
MIKPIGQLAIYSACAIVSGNVILKVMFDTYGGNPTWASIKFYFAILLIIIGSMGLIVALLIWLENKIKVRK